MCFVLVSVQFFPGVIMEAEVAYFIERCDLITDAMRADLQEEFMAMLRGRNICVEENENVCDIGDVEISCGANVDEEELGMRRRRATNNMAELRIKFKVKVENVTQSQFNCTAKCLHVEAMRNLCVQKCIMDFESNRTQVLQNQASKVRNLFDRVDIESHAGPRPSGAPPGARGGGGGREDLPERRPNLSNALRVGGLVLLPKQGFTGSDAVTSCGQGMARTNGLCGEFFAF